MVTQAGGNLLRATPFAALHQPSIESKKGQHKPVNEYTYPQLLVQISATRPGSILDR